MIIIDHTTCGLYLYTCLSSSNYSGLISIELLFGIIYMPARLLPLVSWRIDVMGKFSCIIRGSFPPSHFFTSIFNWFWPNILIFIYILHYLMEILVFVLIDIFLRHFFYGLKFLMYLIYCNFSDKIWVSFIRVVLLIINFFQTTSAVS